MYDLLILFLPTDQFISLILQLSVVFLQKHRLFWVGPWQTRPKRSLCGLPSSHEDSALCLPLCLREGQVEQALTTSRENASYGVSSIQLRVKAQHGVKRRYSEKIMLFSSQSGHLSSRFLDRKPFTVA